jgi:hypothetical protein
LCSMAARAAQSLEFPFSFETTSNRAIQDPRATKVACSILLLNAFPVPSDLRLQAPTISIKLQNRPQLSVNLTMQANRQAVGHQRSPAGLQVEQLRGGMPGEQRRQRAEGLAGCRLAGAAVKARADQGDGAERSAEQKVVASLALEVPTTALAAAVPRQETRRLGRNQARLRAGQHGLGLLK